MAKVTNIYAKVEHPDYGYDSDIEAVKNLDTSKFYEVIELEIGQSHTNFTLKDHNGSFNSVNFAFYDENKKPVDIFSMPEYNPYLNINGRKK